MKVALILLIGLITLLPPMVMADAGGNGTTGKSITGKSYEDAVNNEKVAEGEPKGFQLSTNCTSSLSREDYQLCLQKEQNDITRVGVYAAIAGTVIAFFAFVINRKGNTKAA